MRVELRQEISKGGRIVVIGADHLSGADSTCVFRKKDGLLEITNKEIEEEYEIPVAGI